MAGHIDTLAPHTAGKAFFMVVGDISTTVNKGRQAGWVNKQSMYEMSIKSATIFGKFCQVESLANFSWFSLVFGKMLTLFWLICVDRRPDYHCCSPTTTTTSTTRRPPVN